MVRLFHKKLGMECEQNLGLTMPESKNLLPFAEAQFSVSSTLPRTNFLIFPLLTSSFSVKGKPHGWLKRISRPERAAEENQVFSFLQLSGMVSDHGTRSEM